MNSFDTKALCSEADFSTKLYPGVRWVPIRRLGGTRYTNEQIERSDKAPMQYKCVCTLYELVQWLQVKDYKVIEDNFFVEEDGRLWEYHRDGEAFETNGGGCCATIAAWTKKTLDEYYNKISMILILSECGSCHIVNLFEHNDKMYIFDMYSMTNRYKRYVPLETGKLSDFLKTKIITGGLLEINSLEDFASYFVRYSSAKKDHYVICQLEDAYVPPVVLVRRKGYIGLTVRTNSNIKVVYNAHDLVFDLNVEGD